MKSEDRMIKSFDEMLTDGGWGGLTGDTVIRDLAANMSKAMGTDSMGGTLGDGTALRLENLDATMTSILFDQSHLVLFSWLAKVPSIQPIYQWNRRQGYGSHRGSPGFREGGTPQGGQGRWSRETDQIRYMGVRRGITHQMLQTGAMGGTQVDPVTEENTNGTMQLLEMIERWLFWGDGAIKDNDGNAVNYDGILKQMQTDAASRVIDMKGNPLTFAHMEEAGYNLFQEGKLKNFSNVRAFMTGQVLSDLSKMKLSSERKTLGTSQPGDYIPGVPLAGYDTNFGYIPFEPSVFMDAEVEGGRPLLAADPGAPAAPAAAVGVATDENPTTNLSGATYYYSAASLSDAGESLNSAVSAGVATDPGQKVTLTITRENAATAYRVYRGTSADEATHLFIGHIVQPANGNAVFVDKGQVVPGSGTVAIMERSPENLAIAQLAPLIKFPLGIVSTTIEFLLLLYHTVVVKAPERQIIFRNVGRWEG